MNIIRVLIALVAPEAEALLQVAKVLKLKPQDIVKLAKAKPKALIARIEKLKPGNKKLFSNVIEGLFHDQAQVARNLQKLGTSGRKNFAEFTEATTKINETKNLSSSWIRKGHFQSLGIGSSGELTIWTKSGGRYTYPGVDVRTWKAMKKAKGKNGGGAGSVFWALYLRGFQKSYTGQLLAKLGKLTGIKTPLADINKLRK